MHIEIQMRSGHLLWAKNRQTSEVIDIQGLFNDYWSSNDREFLVSSQSCHHLVRSFLIEKCRGHCRWKASLFFSIPILCRHYRSSLCNHPSQPTNDVRIGGISTFVAPQTRRVVEGILYADEWANREDCGEGYQIRLCIRRGQFSHLETCKALTSFS
jgi:hypothetical protein